MSDFEARKKELLQPVFFEAGAALLDCQSFEYGIALLLFYFSRLGVEGLTPESIVPVLENQDKKTAGQLIGLLKKHAAVTEGMEKLLNDALAARNAIIHRALIDNAERLGNAEGRKALVREIRTLRTRVQDADKKLRPIISSLGRALDGFDTEAHDMEIRKEFS